MLHEWETQKAESDNNKRRHLYYKQEIGSGVDIFRDPEDPEVAWHDDDVKVGSVRGLHPSLSVKPKFWESRNVKGSDSVTWN